MNQESKTKRDFNLDETTVGRPGGSDSSQINVPLSRHLANPLHGIPREQLERDVELFAQEKGLTEHLPDLQKGAQLAQNPGGFEGLDRLDEEDRKVIRYERAHKWSHPKLLYITVFLCSVGAATQGWDQVSPSANSGSTLY